MSRNAVTYYSSATMAERYCERCAPALFGIIADIEERQLIGANAFVCVFCQRTVANKRKG